MGQPKTFAVKLGVLFDDSVQLPPNIASSWKNQLLELDKYAKDLECWTLKTPPVCATCVEKAKRQKLSKFIITFTHHSLTTGKSDVRAARAAYWELILAVTQLCRKAQQAQASSQLSELLFDKVHARSFEPERAMNCSELWGFIVEIVVAGDVEDVMGYDIQGPGFKDRPDRGTRPRPRVLPKLTQRRSDFENESFPLAAEHIKRDAIEADGSLHALSRLFSKRDPHIERRRGLLVGKSVYNKSATASEVAKQFNREMENSIEWHAVRLQTFQSLVGKGGVLGPFIRKHLSAAEEALKVFSDSEASQDEEWTTVSEKMDFYEKMALSKEKTEQEQHAVKVSCWTGVSSVFGTRDTSRAHAKREKALQERHAKWIKISLDYERLRLEVKQLHWALSEHHDMSMMMKLSENPEAKIPKPRKMFTTGYANRDVMQVLYKHYFEWIAPLSRFDMYRFCGYESGLAKHEEDVWKHVKAIYRDIEGLGCRVTVETA